jgi:zinc-ribbon domain
MRVNWLTMKCPQCHAENAEGQNFCSGCGSLLNPQLVPLIRSQVEEYVREHFKDKNLVELEASEAVAGRVLKWARLYYAVPVAVLIIILALLGVSDYSDFHKTVHRATDELTPKLNHAIAVADAATNKAQAAETKSDEAIKAIDAATAKMNAQLASAQQLAAKVSGLESKTTSQIADASKHVEGRVTELDKSVESANKAIAEQQKKLINTNELVTLLYSKGEVESFSAAQGNSAKFVVYAFPLTNNAQKGALVFMLLKSAPIFQTLQINFRIYVQPKSSYSVRGNIVRFVWGDPAENLKQWPLEVSYVPDPTYKGVVYSNLSVKDGHIVADEQQIQ